MPPDGPQADPSATLATLAARLRVLRNRADLTLAELAARAGVGKSTLAQIESGKANPSVETLFALATALGVPLGHLLMTAGPRVDVVRKGQGARMDSTDATFHAELITSTGRRGSAEIIAISLEQGGSRLADPHSPGTVEHVCVVEGRLRVGPVERTVDLEAGDLASFDADVPHVYETLGCEARAIVVADYPF